MHGYDTYDYGFRGYYPAVGRFTTVDPLAEKYYGISPYVYCAGNPIMFIDPDGREIVIGTFWGRVTAKLGFDNYESKVQKDIEKLKDISSELKTLISQIEDSPTTYQIKNTSERVGGKKGNAYDKKNNTMYYDPDNNKVGGKKRDPIVGLAHEMGHVENDENNKSVDYDKQKAQKGDPKEAKKGNENEKRSIYLENIVREELNLPLRDYDYYKIK